ncbi:MAG: hypothetical protein IJT27_03525 [Clostridia bacterium]|nr:hypothetical protein [Clostridia bacterium]
MAQCPKCGRKLHLFNWRPTCPDCGVNMVYYKSNDRLLEETEKTEIEHAKHQPAIDRAKAAFFGSPLAIARIVLSVLPLGALFLPLATLTEKGETATVNGIYLFQTVKSVGFGALFSGALQGETLKISVLLMLVSAAMILVCLICLPMSLGRHGKARNLILNLLLLLPAAEAAVMLSIGENTGVALSFGAYVYLGLCFAILIYNLILAKVGLPVRYTVCYIGGLPSDEYFALVEKGWSDLEIRKKMVEALTAMQENVRAEAAEEEAKKEAERAAWK